MRGDARRETTAWRSTGQTVRVPRTPRLGDRHGAPGWCTSGGYSHWTGKSLAMGFIPADRVEDGLALEVEILGERRPARVHLAPVWDDGGRMRD